MRLLPLSELLKIRQMPRKILKSAMIFQKNRPKLSWPCNFIVWPIRISLLSKMRKPIYVSRLRPWLPSLETSVPCLMSWNVNSVISRRNLVMTVVQSCKRKPRPLKLIPQVWLLKKKPMSASLAVAMSNVLAHVLSMLQRLMKSENVMMMIWFWFSRLRRHSISWCSLTRPMWFIVQSMSCQIFVGRIWESIYHKPSLIYLRMKKCFTPKSWMILKLVLT